jgi:hypothetical protein
MSDQAPAPPSAGGRPPAGPGGGHPAALAKPFRAFLVVLVALVVGVAVLARQGSAPKVTAATEPSTTVAHNARVTTTVPATTLPPTTTTTVPPSSVKVLVLNGWTTAHGALYFQKKLQGEGYDTLAPYNATSSSIKTSQVLYASSPYRVNAADIARQLQVPASGVRLASPSDASAVPSNLLGQAEVIVVIGEDISNQVPANYT